MGRITAIPGASRECGTIAQIFMTCSAIVAMAAAMSEPGNADAITDRDIGDPFPRRNNDADNFVPGNDGEAGFDLPIDDMQIGSADAASSDLDEKLASTRRWNLSRDEPQRRADRFELHREHLGHSDFFACSRRGVTLPTRHAPPCPAPCSTRLRPS